MLEWVTEGEREGKEALTGGMLALITGKDREAKFSIAQGFCLMEKHE